jgi:hypothetical protein
LVLRSILDKLLALPGAYHREDRTCNETIADEKANVL